MIQEADRIIGQNIAIRRELLNMDKDTLAGVLCTSREHIDRIEQGTKPLSAGQLFILARFFNCSLDALCGFSPIDESIGVTLVSAKDILDKELPGDFMCLETPLRCFLYRTLKMLALAMNVARRQLDRQPLLH